MYKDLLGQNREHVEARMRDVDARSKGTSETSYKIRKNLSIEFHFDNQNKVKQIIFLYREGISPEQAIEEIGYRFGECRQTGQKTYTIQISAGAQYIQIDSNPQRERTIVHFFGEHNDTTPEEILGNVNNRSNSIR